MSAENIVPLSESAATSKALHAEFQLSAPEGVDYNTVQVSSMKELKEKAPEVYEMTMKSLASRFINDMKRHQERFKKMMREARQA